MLSRVAVAAVALVVTALGGWESDAHSGTLLSLKAARTLGFMTLADANTAPPIPGPLALPPSPIVPADEVGYLPASWDVTATGAFTYSIPIEVPQGRAGMQPSLSLTYSSGAGNGWLGEGWSL